MRRARALHIDQALVRAAAPVQRRIGKRLFKASVHQYIDRIQYGKLGDLLPAVAGIHPDGLIRKTLTDLPAQRTDRLPVAREQRSPPENVTPEI